MTTPPAPENESFLDKLNKYLGAASLAGIVGLIALTITIYSEIAGIQESKARMESMSSDLTQSIEDREMMMIDSTRSFERNEMMAVQVTHSFDQAEAAKQLAAVLILMATAQVPGNVSNPTATALAQQVSDIKEKLINLATDEAHFHATSTAIATLSTPFQTPSSLVFVETGEFLMGSASDDSFAYSDERPQHSVMLDSYWIDRYEVSNSQYLKFVENTNHRVPYIDADWASNYSWEGGIFPAGQSDYPVVLVSWFDAKSYCAWAGGRLPTEAEWEKAARGASGNTYPWGNDTVSCEYAVIDQGGKGCGSDGIWPIGSKPKGQSPYGAFDMSGNVWEWTSSLYREYPYRATDNRENLEAAGDRVVRGGTWDDNGIAARSAQRRDIPADSRNISLGFRCVTEEPEMYNTK